VDPARVRLAWLPVLKNKLVKHEVFLDPITDLIIRSTKDLEVRRFPLAMLTFRAAAYLLRQNNITESRGNGNSVVKMVSNGL